MILTFCGEKGGAGKSALTLHLGALLRDRGLRVLIVDADPQGACVRWHATAGLRGYEAPTTIGVGDGLRRTVLDLAGLHDLVLIDTAGRLSLRLGAALGVSHVAILPVKPQTSDIWALDASIEAVREVQAVHESLAAYLVLTCGRRARIAAKAEAAVAKAKLPTLATRLRYSSEYDEAQAAGRGLTQHKRRSPFAAELVALADELTARFFGGRRHAA